MKVMCARCGRDLQNEPRVWPGGRTFYCYEGGCDDWEPTGQPVSAVQWMDNAITDAKVIRGPGHKPD